MSVWGSLRWPRYFVVDGWVYRERWGGLLKAKKVGWCDDSYWNLVLTLGEEE